MINYMVAQRSVDKFKVIFSLYEGQLKQLLYQMKENLLVLISYENCSTYPLLALITRRGRETTWSHVTHTVSASTSWYYLVSFCFRSFTFGWETMQIFCSKMEHIPKPIGNKSSKNEGRSSIGQNALKLSLYHSWTILAIWLLHSDAG